MLNKIGVQNYLKTHFEQGNINEELINRVGQLSGKYYSFGQALNLIEMVGYFFFDFMKEPPLLTRAYSRNLRQRSILARRGTFL